MHRFLKQVLSVCNDLSDKNNLDDKLEQEKRELKESIKYYDVKLKDLEQKSVNSKKMYNKMVKIGAAYLLLSIGLMIVMVCKNLTEDEISICGNIIDIVGAIIIPTVLLIGTRAYTVYLTSDQMRYECRDELFKNLTKLKRIRELESDEQKLYDDTLMKTLK